MTTNQSELDNDTVLMHKIDEILYGEHETPYSTGDQLLMLTRNQIAQHVQQARIDELYEADVDRNDPETFKRRITALQKERQ